MLIDVVSVTPVPPYSLHVVFENGVNCTVDLWDLVPFRGVFAPMEDETFFQQVTVHHEVGTVCWPNGADLDSANLYRFCTSCAE